MWLAAYNLFDEIKSAILSDPSIVNVASLMEIMFAAIVMIQYYVIGQAQALHYPDTQQLNSPVIAQAVIVRWDASLHVMGRLYTI